MLPASGPVVGGVRLDLHQTRVGVVLVRSAWCGLAFMVASFAQSGAYAVCLNPFGCGPKSYEACMRDAADKPTDAGVKLASQQCYLIFKKPEEDRSAAAREAQAKRFADVWRENISKAKNSNELLRHFGDAAEVDGPYPCSHVAGVKPPPATTCMRFEWPDKRAGRICSPSGIYRLDSECKFRAEVFLDGARTLEVWAWWPESY